MSVDRDEVLIEACGASWRDVQIARLAGKESISAPFVFDVEIAVGPTGEFDPGDALGVEVELVFMRRGDECRRIHGIVTIVDDLLLPRAEHRQYRLQVQPRVHSLALVETQEIFLGATVPDIIAQKLELAGFLRDSDFRFALSGAYPAREFVVQYRETDLAFISRLAEHLGISFFFEHVEGASGGQGHDRIVFTDQAAEFPMKLGGDESRFQPAGSPIEVIELQSRRAVMPTFWAIQDYNYRIPTVDLAAAKELSDGNGGGVVEYAPNAKSPDEARTLVEVRAQEREALCRFHTGASHIAEFAAGAKFDLVDHPHVADGTRFLLVEVEHTAEQVTGLHGDRHGDLYRNKFRAVLASTTYRPPRQTPKPRIHGVLTATVSPLASGSLGSSAQLDDEGRYRLRFQFDTAPSDERTVPSHPVRQIQQHAGPNYGTHFPLKPGTEVLVAFHDGDPDRPLIVGAAPNAITPSPVGARDAQKHRIKTAAGVLIEMGERPRAR